MTPERDQGSFSPRLPAALEALDEAVRGISGVLDLEQVLQLIVDRVRDLVAAQYAAMGIVDDERQIIRFITSGITAEQRAAIGDLPLGRGLLGLIIRENRSYRIADIGSHPESFGFPPNHPAMRSFLGVPITVQGEPVGRLYLTNKLDAAEFGAEDQALVETFALHAGIAMENVRLHTQVQRLAIIEERERISRDLHDSIIQSIYGVTLALDDVPELVAEDPAEASERVERAIDALHGVIRDIRNFIFGLRPLLLDSGDLLDGLHSLAAELRRSTAVDIEVRATIGQDLPLAVVAELLAITREALANVARHSGASHVEMSAALVDGTVRLEITDDGAGFAPTARRTDGHHGLANIRHRAEGMGGTFIIESGEGRGTRIIVAVPKSGRPRRADRS
ncbi:MAG: GAF domain-containing sensor histidine kinase [Chloroflexota bacterium]|nr:GAF domain-containing sensor histidine kinase [Chloroflexota bacterium]